MFFGMSWKRVWLSLLVLALGAGLSGFRALNPEVSKDIESNAKSFAVKSHAELYTMVRVDNDGSVHIDKWLLAYEYRGDATRGIWRILPDDDQDAVTLLSLQRPGQPPQIWLKDGSNGEVKEVKGIDQRRAFGPSDWNIEDIYDDDKNNWRHRRLGNATIRGQEAIVIESRYSDPELKENSRYDKRRVYLGLLDRRFLESDYYDASGDLIKTVNAAHHVNVGTTENPRIRARRLEILDFVDGSITVMVQIMAAFDLDLPAELFTPEALASWDAHTDKDILARLNPVSSK